MVSALIRSGFVVTGSWPIQTEMQTRQRAMASAALSSSIWLVCRKRPRTARVGWEARVLADMRERITQQLRDFWDAGIRGPDFVWSATGPVLEAFSRHPVVKSADRPGETTPARDRPATCGSSLGGSAATATWAAPRPTGAHPL